MIQAPAQFETPISFDERLKERERVLVGMLDWDVRQIAMACDSRIERDMRLGACHKEPETVDWLQRVVKDDTVVFDVGACSGSYSLIAAALKGSVYAFEPSAYNYRQIVRNASLNRLPVNAFPVALGAERKITGIRLSSAVPGAASHTLTDQTFGEGEDGHLVMVWPMDEFRLIFGLPVVEVLKVDTDGNELDVLRGAPMTLASLRHLMIEVTGATIGPVDALVRSAGMRLVRRYPRIGPDTFNLEYQR